jgi:hypothetical protein
MKYFSMDGRIDKEMFEKFVVFYNENCLKECAITLRTIGGETYVSEAIVRMLNEMKNVTLIIQAAYSAGFEIAMYSKCKKVLSKTAKGMWHYGRADISVNVKNKPYYREDECTVSNLPIERKQGVRLAKKVMTGKEFKLFKKDYDIYFDFKRMKQIFPDAKVI